MSQAPTSGTPEDFDVVILGAGINGAGLFRDCLLYTSPSPRD